MILRNEILNSFFKGIIQCLFASFSTINYTEMRVSQNRYNSFESFKPRLIDGFSFLIQYASRKLRTKQLEFELRITTMSNTALEMWEFKIEVKLTETMSENK